MGRKFEAAMAVASPDPLEEEEEAAAAVQARPARWSIRRMLAVSAVISAALWTLIVVAAVGLAN